VQIQRIGGDVLTEPTEVTHQLDLLCRTSAKKLYNLARYTVDDSALAESIAIDALTAAVLRHPDFSESRGAEIDCCGFLYRFARRARKKNRFGFRPLRRKVLAGSGPPLDGALRPINRLFRLSFDERFLLILFCYCKFTIEEISQIMRLPKRIAMKRLYRAAKKSAELG
jgi:hypothetical protein